VFDGGAVSEELVESTLFGHLRGSFTGAIADRAGVFTEADGGTVFLDEIGELPLELQPVLLRAVDRGMVRPVGAVAYRTVDVRVIAATHRRLDALIDRGDFREDLFYRLAVVRVVVPPLRERPEDIEPLARAILAGAGRPGLEIVPATLETLRAHDWPGNVRELRNVIDAALALAPHADELVLREIPRRGRRAEAAAAELRPFRDAKAAAVEAFERAYLTDLVQRYPTITAAADAAGMDRKHLRGLLGRFDLRIR
jgi:transcriptional regulator with PAS, ATPase and Fis domain